MFRPCPTERIFKSAKLFAVDVMCSGLKIRSSKNTSNGLPLRRSTIHPDNKIPVLQYDDFSPVGNFNGMRPISRINSSVDSILGRLFSGRSFIQSIKPDVWESKWR